MYKKVKQYAMDNHLSIAEKKGLIYGKMNGFFITIHQDPVTAACHTVQIWAKQGNMIPTPAIVDFVNQCPPKYQYLQTASYNGSKITAQFQGFGFQWGKKYVPCLDAFLKDITTYCSTNGLVPCCESCGSEYSLGLYQTDEGEHMLCSTCQSTTSQQVQNAANLTAKKGHGNIVGGIIGALLGSLIGVIAWVLIYQLGYLSALGGLIMIVCALKGYEMLGGILNKTGIIISCILSLLMLLLAEQFALSIEIYNAYKDYYEITFFDAFQSAPSFLTEPDVRSAVIYDLAIGYVLMIVGAWSTIRQAYKRAKGGTGIQMIVPVSDSGEGVDVR